MGLSWGRKTRVGGGLECHPGSGPWSRRRWKRRTGSVGVESGVKEDLPERGVKYGRVRGSSSVTRDSTPPDRTTGKGPKVPSVHDLSHTLRTSPGPYTLVETLLDHLARLHRGTGRASSGLDNLRCPDRSPSPSETTTHWVPSGGSTHWSLSNS